MLMSDVLQSKVRDKELELEAKFDARIQHLQSVQQTLLEKLAAVEQRAVAMHIGKTASVFSLQVQYMNNVCMHWLIGLNNV